MAAHVFGSRGIEHSGGRRHQVSPLLVMLKDVARKLAASWDWYQNYRKTEGELARLSDRELNDIGVPRHDIPMFAMKSANASQDRR